MALIMGTSSAEALAGTSGDDTLVGNGGRDSLDGGAGFDTADFAGTPGDPDLSINLVMGLEIAVTGTALLSIEAVERRRRR